MPHRLSHFGRMITNMLTDPPPDSADTTGPDEPPGPWRWIRLDPGVLYDRQTPERDADSVLDAGLRQPAGDRGWGLVDADGNVLLAAAGGWASPELAGGTAFSPDHPLARLLARAGEIPGLEAALDEVRRQAAELVLLEGQQDEAEVRIRHLEHANEALGAELAAARARIEEMTSARAEAVAWARLLVDTFGLPARTGLGPPPAWLLGAPERP